MKATVDPIALASLQRDALEYVKREEACLSSLLDAVRKMQALLGRGRWAELGDWMPTLEPVLAEREGVEQMRRELQQRLAELPAKTPGAANLDRLADALTRDEGNRLRERKARLRTLAAELQNQAKTAAYLARHHLDYFEGFFAELTRPAGSAATYGREGQLHQGVRTSLLQVRG